MIYIFQILLFLCSIAISIGFTTSKDTQSTSLLYNNKGQLIADTNYRLTKQQLLKFTRIENRFINKVLDSLKIDSLLLENAVEFEVIISFTIDEHSCFSNLHIEKLHNIYDGMIVGRIKATGKYMFINSILQCSCKFKRDGFRADKKKCEQYYLPIKFAVHKENREIKNGRLLYQKIQTVTKSQPVE